MDLKAIRKDFPVFKRKIHGQDLVYLDNAATTQRPACVVERLNSFYYEQNANIHRALHTLSEEATAEYEKSRQRIQKFIGAKSEHEVIFTSGTTAAINLVAQSLAQDYLKKDDVILLSRMEHHSNIVPWQMACERSGAKIEVIPFNNKGELDLAAAENLLKSTKAKILSFCYISNTLGTINPVKQLCKMAHEHNVLVHVDAAQALVHQKIDVQDLDVDLMSFSSHKAYGPTGAGFLYGKEKWLERMPPFLGGGDMIDQVSFTKTTYNKLPFKFEAGTPPIAQVIAMARALEYFDSFSAEEIFKHEDHLLELMTKKLKSIEGLKVFGEAENKTSVLSFNVDGVHAQDLGTLLDQQGIAVRTGQHCTQPIMDFYGIHGTLRASLAMYNNEEDVEILYEALKKSLGVLR